jgi:predicted O-methyltransferase YrrM
VEVGSFYGIGSLFLCKALKEIGSGEFIGYEIQEDPRYSSISKLESYWPKGNWKFKGDFWNEYDGQSVDFAYIDTDPKQDYVRAFKHLNMERTSMVVAHDLFMGNEYQPVVAALSKELSDFGYNVLNLRRERGFIIGERN